MASRYNIKHKFGGNHALGGERNDKEHLRQWFQRLGRVVPGLHLTVQDIWVKVCLSNPLYIRKYLTISPGLAMGHDRLHSVDRDRRIPVWRAIQEPRCSRDQDALGEGVRD